MWTTVSNVSIVFSLFKASLSCNRPYCYTNTGVQITQRDQHILDVYGLLVTCFCCERMVMSTYCLHHSLIWGLQCGSRLRHDDIIQNQFQRLELKKCRKLIVGQLHWISTHLSFKYIFGIFSWTCVYIFVFFWTGIYKVTL